MAKAKKLRELEYTVMEKWECEFIQRHTESKMGHSYLECDKNMGNINLKTKIETPNDWFDLLTVSRRKPSPFSVQQVSQTMIKDWTSFLKNLYVKKCPFPIQKMKEVSSTVDYCRFILNRDSYNGSWNQELIPITNEKFKDLMVLKQFCEPVAAEFFSNLPHE
ncbi:hypothetical protein CBL_12829 [Carabus blaptoides fortunei]